MTRNFPSGELRVSDAERDVALAELSEHFQAGRLSQDEFDERSDRALKARTGDDLHGLFTDLPVPGTSMADPASGLDAGDAGDTGARPVPGPAGLPARGHWPAGRIVILCVLAAIVISNVTVNVGHNASHVNFGWLVPVIVMLFVFRGIRR
jgi:Domain of unknown function (DUF1707)